MLFLFDYDFNKIVLGCDFDFIKILENDLIKIFLQWLKKEENNIAIILLKVVK